MVANTATACENNVQFKALTQAAFRLNNLLTAERDRAVADLGLTSARWQVLEAVGLQTTAVSAAHVARQLQISRQAVQRVLNDLAQLALVELKSDAADKRAQLVSLTHLGTDVLGELDKRTDVLRHKVAEDHQPIVADFLALAGNGRATGWQDGNSDDSAPSAGSTVARTTPWPTRATDASAPNAPRTFENVQGHILDRIRSGDLHSGDRLPPERELASSLGVGRSAVREALRSLEMSGVLRFKRGAGGGAFVRESGSEGIESSIRSMLILGRLPLADLLEVRASLLGQCARLGAQRGTQQDFARLDTNIDELERCVRTYKDQVAAIKPATEFYRLAARSSHNRLMILLVDAIADLVAEMLTQLKHRPRLDSVTARRDMVAAMREGRADDAARVIRTHSYDTNRLLLRSRRPFALQA
ncbi:GntR family transcriptional regulator [Novosphingobium lentum]|uniref:GntR family transcriptional regulator n=1 Tax=Novosphingobium lentum TaxID=145287 RepID=UPI00082B6B85|nr:GntR family transcriptional regulator [Novosphingobium lentum]